MGEDQWAHTRAYNGTVARIDEKEHYNENLASFTSQKWGKNKGERGDTSKTTLCLGVEPSFRV